jgi:hypothetical protein
MYSSEKMVKARWKTLTIVWIFQTVGSIIRAGGT